MAGGDHMRVAVLTIAAVLAATAQTPDPRPSNWCGYTGPNGGAPKADVLEPAEFAIPRGDFCEHYTYDAGWEDTMVLQLGEGAEEYREWIEMAVDVWNDALDSNSFGRVLRISNERPRNYRIPRSFWEDFEADGEPTLDQQDDENVIYFKPSREYAGTLGLAQIWDWPYRNELAEADIYVNTYFEEEADTPVAEIGKLMGHSHDGEYGIWLYYHSAYITILHELVHAVGLGHVPVASNIMSYSRWENLRDQWEPAMQMHMHMLHRYSGIGNVGHDFFVDREETYRGITGLPGLWIGNTWHLNRLPIDNDRVRILTNFYTSKIRLGEMEKMLLACVYEF